MIGILFDLDGTLLDTLEDLADAVNYALAHHGYPQRTLEEVRRFVGNGAARLISLAVPEGTAFEPVLETFHTYYRSHSQVKTRPYPGIPEMLDQVRAEYPVAVVSNKPDPAVKPICADFFGDVYALGEAPGCPRKPAPDMLFKAMKDLGVDRCLYVGDSEVDVITAKNAGAECVSVLWGFRDEEEIREAGGKHFCRQVSQLPEMIRSLAQK